MRHRGRRRAVVVGGIALCAAAAGFLLAQHGRPPRRVTPHTGHARTRPRRAALPRVRGPHVRPVPILMYHVISPPPADAPYVDLYVTPADFAGQMRWLRRHGYHAVTLRRVYDYWRSGVALPRRPIVLSFDDGYRSDYTHALPMLRSLGWPGVLNLEVRHENNFWGMPPGVVRRLIAAGWEIDAHTINHPDLTTLGAADLRHEVAGSRASIRREFHVPVEFFCYPSGRYDATVIAAVRAAGFLGATTTDYGPATPGDLFTLRRVRVNGSDGVAGFASKLQALSSSRS